MYSDNAPYFSFPYQIPCLILCVIMSQFSLTNSVSESCYQVASCSENRVRISLGFWVKFLGELDQLVGLWNRPHIFDGSPSQQERYGGWIEGPVRWGRQKSTEWSRAMEPLRAAPPPQRALGLLPPLLLRRRWDLAIRVLVKVSVKFSRNVFSFKSLPDCYC